MARRRLSIFAALLCLLVLPLESSGQTPAPGSHTIAVTGIYSTSYWLQGLAAVAFFLASAAFMFWEPKWMEPWNRGATRDEVRASSVIPLAFAVIIFIALLNGHCLSCR